MAVSDSIASSLKTDTPLLDKTICPKLWEDLFQVVSVASTLRYFNHVELIELGPKYFPTSENEEPSEHQRLRLSSANSIAAHLDAIGWAGGLTVHPRRAQKAQPRGILFRFLEC